MDFDHFRQWERTADVDITDEDILRDWWFQDRVSDYRSLRKTRPPYHISSARANLTRKEEDATNNDRDHRLFPKIYTLSNN